MWEVFEEERPNLVPYRGRFDGFHALPASVSRTEPKGFAVAPRANIEALTMACWPSGYELFVGDTEATVHVSEDGGDSWIRIADEVGVSPRAITPQPSAARSGPAPLRRRRNKVVDNPCHP